MTLTSGEKVRIPLRFRIRQLLQDWDQNTEEDGKVWRTKIQPLPISMRGRVDLETFYTPKLIAIGPIHSERLVGLGEQQKVMLTTRYLNETSQRIDDLVDRMHKHLGDPTQLFSPHCLIEHDYEDLMWMLVVDGCSVLQVLDKSNNSDSEEALQVSVDQLVRLHEDLLLLENQIPFQVLKLLCVDQARLKKCIDDFVEIRATVFASRTRELDVGKEKENSTSEQVLGENHKVIVLQEDQDQDNDPVHLLDHLHRAILRNMSNSGGHQIHDEDSKSKRKSLHLRKYRIGSIRELKEAGIRVKKHQNKNSFHPNFVDGQLLLPDITVDGSTALIFLNLVAYEMCPDFRNDFEISSFVVFLSSLIEQQEDVKLLRSAGILRNELASDKEVADLFNKMDIIIVPETERYASIVKQIEAYIESRRGKIKMLGWMGEAYNTYFRSPWTIIALLAASFGLALTFIQTWFAIHPKAS